MMSAMYPTIIVSAVVFLLVFTCMWRTEKDEQADLAEDEADDAEEKVKQEEDSAVKKPPRSRHTTDLDHAKSAHHHDHFTRRTVEISRSTHSIKRAQRMATKQQVMKDIMNRYVSSVSIGTTFSPVANCIVYPFTFSLFFLQVKNHYRLGTNCGVVVRHLQFSAMAPSICGLYHEFWGHF
jgi:hypothetical protein